MINTVEELIFIRLSHFDRDQFVTQRLKQSMTKLLMMFYLNITVAVILIYSRVDELSAELPADSPLFKGKYLRFDMEWYKKVGSTIMMSLIIQIVAPHSPSLFRQLTSQCSRCFDRGCTKDARKTRQIL